MDAQSFATGQVVQLKSGGPDMVVEEVSRNELLCVWFSKRQLHRKTFSKGLISHTYQSALNRQISSKRMRNKLSVIRT